MLIPLFYNPTIIKIFLLYYKTKRRKQSMKICIIYKKQLNLTILNQRTKKIVNKDKKCKVVIVNLQKCLATKFLTNSLSFYRNFGHLTNCTWSCYKIKLLKVQVLKEASCFLMWATKEIMESDTELLTANLAKTEITVWLLCTFGYWRNGKVFNTL